ncbi:MAG: hypothetical protein GY935_24040 [Gammaproteobacteria bacterium]|nr:hypothetical protein [Gammaproteobacteria bacterium]
MIKRTISVIGTTAQMLVAYTRCTIPAIAADRLKKGLPPNQVVAPVNAEESPLYQRLTQNWMPAGISPSKTRDHPNLRLLERWIAQGAKCE